MKIYKLKKYWPYSEKLILFAFITKYRKIIYSQRRYYNGKVKLPTFRPSKKYLMYQSAKKELSNEVT